METGLNRPESFFSGVMPSSNIPDLTRARQDLPLPDSQIGVLEPWLYVILYMCLLPHEHSLIIIIIIIIIIITMVKIMVNNSNNEIIIIIIIIMIIIDK